MAFCCGGINSDGDYFLYVDGISEGTLTPNVALNWNGNTRIGLYSYSTGYYFDGFLSDVRIYDGALTTEQISQLYKSGQTTAKVKVDARNLVTNGDFNDGLNGWSDVANVTVVNGVAAYDLIAEDGFGSLEQASIYEIGKTYKFVMRYKTDGGYPRLYKGDAYYDLSADIITNDEWHIMTLTYVADGSLFKFRKHTSGGSNIFYIDNISVVDVTNKYSVGSLQKGLILDMPLNEDYSEAVDSGKGFDFVDNSWLSGGATTINDNNTVSTTGGYAVVYKNSFFTVDDVGKKMKLLLTFNNDQGEKLQIRDSSGVLYADGVVSAIYSPGIHVIDIVVTSASNFVFGLQGAGASTYTISVKKIMYPDDIVKDRSPYSNDGTVRGASVEYDGLINTSNGVASIPNKVAYGTWEFDFNVPDDTNHYINFISDGYDIAYNNKGYQVYLDSYNTNINRINFRVSDGVGGKSTKFVTGNNYYNGDTWYRLKITRSSIGKFTVYIKGGSFGWDNWTEVVESSGSNPVIDNDNITSDYFSFHSSDTGLKIRNLKIDGKLVKLSNASPISGSWNITVPSYSFDGTNDYIDSDVENIKGETLSFWFNTSASGVRTIVGAAMGNKNNDYVSTIVLNDGKINARVYSAVNLAYQTTNTYNDGYWHHCVILDQGTDLDFYVDGNLTTKEAGTAIVSQHRFTIGAMLLANFTFDKYWDGQISNIKIWNRVLSADEIDSLYNRER